MDKKLLQSRDNIIESAGRTSQGFGLGRIIGQLYALLFFTPSAMSLDDMAGELEVSKGSVSTNIRELEKWGAVKQVWVKGNRKDFYEAEADFIKILEKGILPFMKRKLESSFVATAESRDLLKCNHKLLRHEDKDLAAFYSNRLNSIEKTRSQLSLLFKFPGL
jgi:DNA-binding transcriptional regulator GbsR (MarR family)